MALSSGPAQLRSAAIAALLKANTLAGARVFASRDIPFALDQLPAISVYAPHERGEALSEAGDAPKFRVTLTLHCVARLLATGADPADPGRLLAETQADTLLQQMKDAILSDFAFNAAVRRIPSMTAQLMLDGRAEGTAGEIILELQAEYDDAYAVPVPDTLETVTLVVTPTLESGHTLPAIAVSGTLDLA